MGEESISGPARAGDASSDAPALSIIVVSYGSGATIARCLEALSSQRTSETVELIVVDSGSDGAAQIVAERFPRATLLRRSTRLYPGAARHLGISRARSEIIGFVDADCVAAPDWAERVVAAHRESPHPVVGGSIDNGDPESLVGWAQFFCEFHQWMPGTPAGSMLDVPTCCFSMKRSAYLRYGPFRSRGYCSDTAFNWRLVAAGEPPRFDPSIRVAHIHRTTPRSFARKQWMHGRAFATMRIDEQHLSRWKRLALAFLSPALPVVLSMRLLRRVVLGRRRHLGRLAAAGPLILAGLCLWSAGEMIGYLAGPSSGEAES